MRTVFTNWGIPCALDFPRRKHVISVEPHHRQSKYPIPCGIQRWFFLLCHTWNQARYQQIGRILSNSLQKWPQPKISIWQTLGWMVNPQRVLRIRFQIRSQLWLITQNFHGQITQDLHPWAKTIHTSDSEGDNLHGISSLSSQHEQVNQSSVN